MWFQGHPQREMTRATQCLCRHFRGVWDPTVRTPHYSHYPEKTMIHNTQHPCICKFKAPHWTICTNSVSQRCHQTHLPQAQAEGAAAETVICILPLPPKPLAEMTLEHFRLDLLNDHSWLYCVFHLGPRQMHVLASLYTMIEWRSIQKSLP